ncbi:MAG: class I SAM-dependent methyltransferase [Alphaproteobacteria bacterium]
MSALAALLRDIIAKDGPITVERYMAEALGHPAHGYYVTRDPLGATGDFTTAPEISQMFGEMIGLWCVATWRRMGAPSPFVLAELGPGRGTLMADALRAARLDPRFLEAARLHLVETSPVLRERQGAALAAHRPAWHGDFGAVPSGPLLLIANEFFDALPIRQFERTADGWRERLVGHDADRFTFVLSSRKPDETLPGDAPVGAIMETSPTSVRVMHDIGERIARHGGAALVIDYGYVRTDKTRAWGDTFQALRGHKRHDPLEAPGQADLTAHVDFAALARAAHDAGAATHGPLPQGLFLKALGIELRALRLARDATQEQRAAIDAALHRLIHADGMGLLFKALAAAHPSLGTPDGFA